MYSKSDFFKYIFIIIIGPAILLSTVKFLADDRAKRESLNMIEESILSNLNLANFKDKKEMFYSVELKNTFIFYNDVNLFKYSFQVNDQGVFTLSASSDIEKSLCYKLIDVYFSKLNGNYNTNNAKNVCDFSKLKRVSFNPQTYEV